VKKILAVALLALMTAPALGQQPPDAAQQVEVYKKAVALISQQRNAAMDDAVNIRLQADKLAEDLKVAQDRIKELEAKLPKEEPKKAGSK